MAKQIYPGNWVNRMSSGHGSSVATGVVCQPGRVYYHLTGYALITSTSATSWAVTLPSPDMRADDKPRTDLTSLVVPINAVVSHVGIRIPDMRKDRGIGAATTGLVATSTNRLKLANAVGSSSGLSATALSTNPASLVSASSTYTPGSSLVSIITPPQLTAALTLSVYSVDSTNTAAGSGVTSTLTGGTPILVEVGYYLDDVVADLNDVRIPFGVGT
jgi:hypothetical protein